MRYRILRKVCAIAITFILIASLFPFQAFAAKGNSPFKSGTYTHSSVFDGMNIYNGIDVSEHQKTINWNKVKSAGVDFAIIRVAGRGYGSGNLYEDKYYRQNLQGAIDAGIKVGVYFFSQAVTVKEAEEEADYILSRISGYNITLPVIFDFEFGSGYRVNALKYKNTACKTAITNMCTAFGNKVKAAGYTPMVYANLTTFNGYMYPQKIISSGCDLWLAQYNTSAGLTYNYVCWQYTSSGKVSGISGNVDCNFWYDNGKYFGGQTPEDPEPDPTPDPAPDPEPTPDPEPDPTPSVSKVTGVSLKTRTTSSVTLGWSKTSGADGYYVYRSDSYGGTYKKIGSTTKTEYKNTGLTQGREYYYKVYACKGSVKSSSASKFVAAAKPKYDRYGKTTENYINMRSHAGISYSAVTMLSKGKTVTILASTRDSSGHTWYKVKYTQNGKSYSGYMIEDYFAITKKGTTTAALNMRKGAGTSYGKITTVPKGKTLVLYSSKTVSGTTWYKVKYKVSGVYKTGWISGSYIKALNL